MQGDKPPRLPRSILTRRAGHVTVTGVQIGMFVCQEPWNQTTTRGVCGVPLVATTMSQAEAPADVRSANRARFELELEFVQSLANPFYLHSLAQQGILNQPTFVNFLKYLQYWKEKDYARFIL